MLGNMKDDVLVFPYVRKSLKPLEAFIHDHFDVCQSKELHGCVSL